jgi:hypothetical protein
MNHIHENINYSKTKEHNNSKVEQKQFKLGF